MSRVVVRCVVAAIVFGGVLHACSVLAQAEAKPSAGTAKAMAERDRLKAQSEWLQRQGKTEEAIAVLGKALALEKANLAADHDDILASFMRLGELHLRRNDLGAGRAAWREEARLARGRFGKDDPRAREAAWRAEYAESLVKAGGEQWRQLREAKAEVAKLLRAGKWHEALAVVEALQEREERLLGTENPLATTVVQRIMILRWLGDHAGAARWSRRILAVRREALGESHPGTINAHEGLVDDLQELAQQYEAKNDFQGAAVVWAEVVALQEGRYGKQDWRVVDARLEQSNARVLRNLTARQRQLLAEANQDDQQTAQMNSKGQYLEALSLLRRMSEVRRQILGEKHPAYATSLNNLAEVCRALGDYQQALKLHLQVRDLRKDILGEKHPTYAATLNNLAFVYRSLGHNHQALRLYQQARDVFRSTVGEKHPGYATTLSNLALVYHALGDSQQALKLHLQVRDLRKEVLGEKHRDYAVTLNNLAMAYRAVGDNAQALKLYLQARDLQRVILGEKHVDYTGTLSNLALVYLEMGENTQALAILRQAHGLETEVLGEKHPYLAGTLNNLAMAYRALGDNQQALKILLQVGDLQRGTLGDKHPDYATTLNNLGVVSSALGDNGQALKFYLQVRGVREETLGDKHPLYAATLNNLAAAYLALRNYPQAADLSRQAMDIFRDALERSAGGLAERQQLAHMESLDGFLSNYLEASARAEVPAADAYAPVLAWRGAVTARQRLTRAARTATNDPGFARLFCQLDDLSRQLAALYHAPAVIPGVANRPARIEQLLAQREEIEARLADGAVAFRRLRAGRSLNPANLQKLLPPDTALIDFVERGSPEERRAGLTVLTAFVVRREGIHRLELDKAKPVAEAVRAFRGTLNRTRPVLGQDDPGVTLRRRVWQPLEGALKGASVVLVSPDGPLNGLPFAALPGRDPGKYLLEEVALAVVPVPQMLPELLERRDPSRADSPPGLLLLGDIDYDAAPGAAPGASPAAGPEAVASGGPRTWGEGTGSRLSWQRLPGMRAETNLISALFGKALPQGRKTELPREQATEAAVRQQAPRHEYFHAATHGFFAPRDVPRATVRDAGRGLSGMGVEQVVGFHPGLLSGLVLAGANKPADEGDDGVLTALEVSELDLSRLELAVLSACATGLGEVAGGEGVLGLQRAFQVAGARSTITSLWKVDDAATRALMARFYDNLWQNNKRPLEALREAQLWMLRGGAGEGASADKRTFYDKPEPGASPWASPYCWAAFVLSGDWR